MHKQKLVYIKIMHKQKLVYIKINTPTKIRDVMKSLGKCQVLQH